MSRSLPLRLDPEQRFACHSCGRCCRRWEILVSPAEVATYRQRNAAQWFRRDAAYREGTGGDPFEAVAGWQGAYRIARRADGACGFLSDGNRCRIHEELGGRHKPLTCRTFPYQFQPGPSEVIVTASFGCPTVVANEGEPIASGPALERIRALQAEGAAGRAAASKPLSYVPGRSMGPDSVRIVREGLLRLLDRVEADGSRDLRANVRRMAAMLDDLARRRVVRLPDEAFAEYVSLTVPYTAQHGDAPADRPPARIGRMLQHGFLFLVAATRLRIEAPHGSRWRLRLAMLHLLAHFHGLAPPTARVDLQAVTRTLDINAAAIQPIARRYLRAGIEALGAADAGAVRDAFAVWVSYLNAAVALAEMSAAAAARPVDAGLFADALMESVDLAHLGGRGLLGRALVRFAGGAEALWVCGAARAAAASTGR